MYHLSDLCIMISHQVELEVICQVVVNSRIRRLDFNSSILSIYVSHIEDKRNGSRMDVYWYCEVCISMEIHFQICFCKIRVTEDCCG